jgi:hypothetical protein
MPERIQQGKWCQFQILTQDGPLSSKVCKITSDLLSLADKCYSPEAMEQLHELFPPGTLAGTRMGAMVGSEFHKILYLLAVKARERGELEPRLKITRPTNQKINLQYTRRGERSGAGPDFVLSGVFDGEDIHAAWDLTTIESIPSHYDRDILGVRRRRRGDLKEHPIDPEIQPPSDNERFWTSYIALYY